MKNVIVGIILILGACQLAADEQLPPERAQKAAELVAAEAAKLNDLPIKTDVDTAKPFGLKKGELAALVIPDKALSQERLDKAAKEVLPVGQLWLKALTPVVAGSAASADKLRLVKVTTQNGDLELPLLLLGARKGPDGKLELLVYAKGKEPLLVLPLEASSRSQDQPIELEGKGEGEIGMLIVHVLGKHEAKLPVAKAQ